MSWHEIFGTFKEQNFVKKVYDLWLLSSLTIIIVGIAFSIHSFWILVLLMPSAIIGYWIRFIVYLKG